jgi:hypothetical protein
MRRPFLIGLLAFGTIAGYSSGFASLRHHSACHWQCDRSSYSDARPEPVTVTAPVQVNAPAPVVAPAPVPVVVNNLPAAPAQPQTIVIPIIVGQGAQGVPNTQPTTYVIPTAPGANTNTNANANTSSSAEKP